MNHQRCRAGACACDDDVRCGSLGAEGDFCPMAGGATFGHCAADGDGCLFVTAIDNACDDGKTCDVAGVVPTGTACGCPADGAALGTGCSGQPAGTVAADTTNRAVIRCDHGGACPLWTLMIDCAGQGLTAATVGSDSVCVCKAPATTLYVDPSPPATSLMQGAPTGAASPAACRLGSLKVALQKAAVLGSVDTIVIAHDDPAAPVHLGAASGETFPIAVPAGMTVKAAGDPAADAAPIVIDVAAVAAAGPAIRLDAGASLRGLTVDAAGATGTPDAGANVDGLVTCAAAAAASPAATLDHVVLLAKAGITGVRASGPCAIAATNLQILGASTGVEVARTAGGGGDVAAFTGMNVVVKSSLPGSVGARVGAGLDGGARSTLALSNATVEVAGSGLVVAGGTASFTNGAIRFAGNNVSATNRGVVVSGGIAAVDATAIAMGAPATGGNVVGVSVTGGQATLTGVNIAGAEHFSGIELSGVGALTLAGGANAKTTIATTLAATSMDPSIGVAILAGGAGAQLTVAGGIEVSGFGAGLVVNDGLLAASGADVVVSHNRGDGVRLLGASPGAAATLDGIAVRDNGGSGLVVRTVAPVAIGNCTITGNAADGIDAQRTQSNTVTGVPQLSITACTVATNGGRGIALSGKGAGTGALAGGKVAAQVTGNTVKSNGNVGVFISEGADAADGDDVTEVWVEDNDVASNLSVSVPSSVMAGGFFFASSDATTRVILRSFLGNKIHGNGRAEIGFDLGQNDGQPWNLSAAAAQTSQLCGDAAAPNAIYCYDNYPGDFAIAVANTNIHLNVKGMHFQDTPAIAGRDFTAGIPSSEITSFCAPQTCP